MKNRVIKIIIKYLILLSIFITYYIINKYTGFYIPCIFRLITGFKCPGCGITHLLFYLFNFDFYNAFKSNPLVFIYLPFIIAYFLYYDYLYILDKKDKFMGKIPNYLWIIIVCITLIYGVLRNIIMI